MSTKTKLELLPNEIFIEYFQYLNASDIFYSFGRLNHRFHTLIRNIPLHLNFQQFKKCLFNEFCQTIISNLEIKQNISCLQLSNEGTYGQIQSFFLLFPLNDFIHLRSLSLINIDGDNAKKVLPMLRFLSDLYYFSCTSRKSEKADILEIIPALSRSKVRILTISHFYVNSTFVSINKSITSLIIYLSSISDLCPVLKYLPMLKCLKLELLLDCYDKSYRLDFNNINAPHLKQLIIGYFGIDFDDFELLLKHIPYLEIFSLSSSSAFTMVDGNRWQHLIESSLPHLRVFNFNFYESFSDPYNDMLIKLPTFQSDFWHKQHRCYTNYEIDGGSASIYTIPYIDNEYRLTSTMQRYSSSSTNCLNGFDNVKNLSLCTSAIRKDSPCFYRNVQSLRLDSRSGSDDETDEYKTKQLQYLNMIINVSNIKNLSIGNRSFLKSSLLLEILKKLPNVSSLKINIDTLLLHLENRQLSEYLKRKITTLDISGDWNVNYFQSNEIGLVCKTFSNLEHLKCDIKTLDDLLLILEECSNLSTIKLGKISKQIYSWIQINASTLNVYLDFESIVDFRWQ